jgi:hypothetical protein
VNLSAEDRARLAALLEQGTAINQAEGR